MEVGKVVAVHGLGPFLHGGTFSRVAFVVGRQLRERCDVAGQGGHLGADGGELVAVGARSSARWSGAVMIQEVRQRMGGSAKGSSARPCSR